MNALPARPFKLIGEFAYHQVAGFVGPAEWVGNEEGGVYEADFCAHVVWIMNGERHELEVELGVGDVDEDSRQLDVN